MVPPLNPLPLQREEILSGLSPQTLSLPLLLPLALPPSFPSFTFICITHFCRSTKICYNPTRERIFEGKDIFSKSSPSLWSEEKTSSNPPPAFSSSNPPPPFGRGRTKEGEGFSFLLPLSLGGGRTKKGEVSLFSSPSLWEGEDIGGGGKLPF